MQYPKAAWASRPCFLNCTGETPMPRRMIVLAIMICLAIGCHGSQKSTGPSRPSVTPTSQPATAALHLDGSQIPPMYREMLAIDLPAVAEVAEARNLDILAARQRVEAS